RYGIDKPDLRYALELRDLTGLLGADAAPFLAEARAKGGRVRGLVLPGGTALSRKDLDALAAAVKEAQAGGLIWARRAGAGWEGQGVKAVGQELLAAVGGAEGDLLLAVAGADAVTSPALHAVRAALTRRPEVRPSTDHAFAWIVDFPLFELDPETNQH